MLLSCELQSAGDIVALFGIECASGDTFTDGSVSFAMTSIKVPEPVMSVALTPKSTDQLQNFQKALARFQKEDPTFHVKNDAGTFGRESKYRGVRGFGSLSQARGVLVVQLRSRVPSVVCCCVRLTMFR